MRRRLLALCALLALSAGTSARAVEVTISCSSLGKEYEICKQGAEAWGKRTGNTVRLVTTPNSATERLGLYQQLLAAGASDVDVFQIDVVWTGVLGEHFVDLSAQAKDGLAAHIPAMAAASRVGDKVVAMPWFADAGLLYYRKDLLEKYGRAIPATWAELEETAREIQEGERKAGAGDFWGYVWQGRAYEGLTANALEWIASNGGGTIVDEAGEITVDNPKATQALARAAGWVGAISPKGVLNYTEEEARGVFQAGNAAFMRNWPYAYSLAQAPGSPVRDRIGVAPLPRGGEGGRQAGALGGQLLAVSRYSKHADAAADLVRHLTSPDEQKRRAVEGSFNPTILALYEDADVLRAAPFVGELRAVFASAVARPAAATRDNYNRVSAETFNAAHQVLSGQGDAESAVKRLERNLRRIKRGDWSR